MHVLYEESGAFKVGTILADNDASLQVEAPHGKRSKIKSNTVLMRFAEPSPAELMKQAEALAAQTDVSGKRTFQAQRRLIREALAREGIADAIDALVLALLNA